MEETNENNLSLEEKWEKATISNNFIFYKVMRNNPDVCKELLEILLEIQIDHIDMKQEEEVQIDYGKKGIRMDVYAVGETKAYNLEMQATDTTELPKYKFENLCIDNPKIKLNDRAYKYFFIAENYAKIQDERQKAFFKLVIDNQPTNAFADKISKLVDDAKHNTQWRKQFMDWEIEKAYSFDAGKKEGIKQGIQQGEQQKAEEIAKKMLLKKIPEQQISELTGMTVETILEIKKEIPEKA